jgi:hypothetical protein
MCFYRKVFLFVGFLMKFFCVLIMFWHYAFIYIWLVCRCSQNVFCATICCNGLVPKSKALVPSRNKKRSTPLNVVSTMI